MSNWREWGAEKLARLVFASPLYSLALGGEGPDHLRGAPPDRVPGDPERGVAILRGDFDLGAQRFDLGEHPFEKVPEDVDARAALHGFGWLAHLRALGTEAAREAARGLVHQWIDHFGRWSEGAWEPEILGRRLAAWFAAYDFLDKDADGDFRRAFLDSSAAQARHLGLAIKLPPPTAATFTALKGLAYAGLCLPGREKMLEDALAAIETEITRQILPDGGQIQRSPALHLDVLEVLLDVRDALERAKVEIPQAVNGAVDRMVPMLESYRMGDGATASFNGGGTRSADRVRAVLGRSGVAAAPLMDAAHVGFQRLQSGRTVLLMDAGRPSATRPWAGTLSFEMTLGKEYLVVNAGSPAGSDPTWGEALRVTAAHSAVVVDDTNSTELLADGELGRAPLEVKAVRRETAGNLWLETLHDGYLENFGLVHARKLFLAAGGEDLRGEDVLKGIGAARAVAVRFHLHPAVHASVTREGHTVLLRLEKAGGWQFQAQGGEVSLQEGVYLGDGAPRRNEQIVVSAPLDPGGETVVKWRFAKMAKE